MESGKNYFNLEHGEADVGQQFLLTWVQSWKQASAGEVAMGLKKLHIVLDEVAFRRSVAFENLGPIL